VVIEVTGQQTAGDPNFPYPEPFTVRTVTYDDYVNEDGLGRAGEPPSLSTN
jgi:hypothetical protein